MEIGTDLLKPILGSQQNKAHILYKYQVRKETLGERVNAVP